MLELDNNQKFAHLTPVAPSRVTVTQSIKVVGLKALYGDELEVFADNFQCVVLRHVLALLCFNLRTALRMGTPDLVLSLRISTVTYAWSVSTSPLTTVLSVLITISKLMFQESHKM